MTNIVFRTNAGSHIGLGHLMRCRELANYIKKNQPDFEIVFRINAEANQYLEGYETVNSEFFDNNDIEEILALSPQMVVVDSYLYNEEYINRLSDEIIVVIFDDVNRFTDRINVALLINGNIYANQLKYNVDDSCTLLLGVEYLIIRDDDNVNCENLEANGVLITTGGSNPYGIALQLASAISLETSVGIIVGPGYTKKDRVELEKWVVNRPNFNLIYEPRSLKEHILEAQVVISATGSTVYEVLANNRSLIIYGLAENQTLIYEALLRYGVDGIGLYPNIQLDYIDSLIEKNQYGQRYKIDELGVGISNVYLQVMKLIEDTV